jgi:hypothetical protein
MLHRREMQGKITQKQDFFPKTPSYCAIFPDLACRGLKKTGF